MGAGEPMLWFGVEGKNRRMGGKEGGRKKRSVCCEKYILTVGG